VADLQPILSGQLFPTLKYLGLRNSHLADEIVAVVINSRLIQRIETLDLSLGTLSDEGARSLLKLPASPRLKRLNLRYNFIGADLIRHALRERENARFQRVYRRSPSDRVDATGESTRSQPEAEVRRGEVLNGPEHAKPSRPHGA